MESHPLVYLRADGNEAIATGHLMRCLSIARALRRQHARPVFLLSDMTSASLLQGMMTIAEKAEKAFPIVNLQTDYRNPEQEIPVLTKLLSAHPAACVLVDSYFVTPRYLSALRQFGQVAYLDDLQAFDYPVDLVINYDIFVDEGFYHNARKVLSGGSYAPLREQFSLCSYQLWDQVKEVFLSTGGTDPFNIAGGLLRQLQNTPQWQDVNFHVLTGPMHIHRAELKALSAGDSRIILHEGVSHMASLMAQCDLAVSAAGTTLYELCAVGVPSVSYSMADNQVPGAKAFDRAGLIPWIGDIRDNPDFFKTACDKMLALAQDPISRREQSTRMRMAVDGAGAERIAASLLA